LSAQSDRPLNWSVESELLGGITTGDTLPLWLYANRYGEVERESNQGSLSIGGEISGGVGDSVDLSGAILVQGQLSEYSKITLLEGYGRASWRPLELSIGRFRHTVGTPDPLLSTGSMAVSANALPIPRIRLAIPEYWSIPYTEEWLQLKGGISHGWLTDDRYIEGALLHEKFLFGRVYSPIGLHAHVGLIHEAFWAGDAPGGTSVNVSWDNFRRVFLIKDAGDDSPTSDQIYKFGNHLGTWDFGVGYDAERWAVQAYYQHFGEDASGTKDFENDFDGLWGIQLDFEELPGVSSVVYEFVYTKDQSGPYTDPSQHRDSYYSHAYYRTGWTYANQIIGNALFGFAGRDEDRRISDNRFVANHIGIAGAFATEWEYRLMATHKTSYPAYAPLSVVPEGETLNSTSLLLEAAYTPDALANWRFGLAVGADLGWESSDGDAVGALINASYRY
jgi:hypothetical protein